MTKLTITESKTLIEKCTTGIDYLLNRLKEYDVLSEKDYNTLGLLDDLIIEYDDLYTNFLHLQSINAKLKSKQKEKQNGQTNI
jgi:hypothetical protein